MRVNSGTGVQYMFYSTRSFNWVQIRDPKCNGPNSATNLVTFFY